MALKNEDKASLKVGTVIVQTKIIAGLGKTEIRTQKFTVVGHRRTPHGLRIRLRDEYGSQCNDADFEYPKCSYHIHGLEEKN